ncbi:RAQPRD family integrative conjugative element protein [Pseudomonas sp. RHF3.3-3]|uniref:Integrative conjugative element protein, RAQPRD family n=1 Tax=Pseudomonas asplenii TaxID=53407 RepID=A0A0M9GG18_9PSED|nr:RAQPRD family integrative conjugative element protein [Pseudomonas fuscovaginae]KPA90354.1 integrative conjugative element protein, RAQPRD family [Pseudomonas fuscovaginae]
MPAVIPLPRYIALSLVLSLKATMAQAEPTAQERTLLSAWLRQLDTLTQQVHTRAAQPVDEQARFHFDYPRLAADLELIQQGIEHYLTPSRAQPRALPELTGHYTQSTEAMP